LNSLFSEGEGEDATNLLQVFVNDGTKQINSMKIRGEKNCRVAFRNLPADTYFHFRIEYSEPNIKVYYFDPSKDALELCTSIEYRMDFNGVYMLTANSGMRDPDHYFIDSFAMYDPSERVSEGHNEHYHEAHKKKAIHDIAIFNHEHHA
jgi:hypothetical protein